MNDEETATYDVGAGVPEGTNLWEFTRYLSALIETRQQVRDLERRLDVLAASQVTPADVARLQDQQLGSALESSAFLVELRRIADALEPSPEVTLTADDCDCDELWRLAREFTALRYSQVVDQQDYERALSNLAYYVREHMP